MNIVTRILYLFKYVVFLFVVFSLSVHKRKKMKPDVDFRAGYQFHLFHVLTKSAKKLKHKMIK